jgi:hypothetical protein
MRNRLIFVFFTLLFSLTITLDGQKLVNSPYSRFNLGTIEPMGSFRGLGMGGISVSLRDNSSISFANPASYSSFDTISFIFDFGLDFSWNKLIEGKTIYNSNDMNFDHLMIGFPLAKGWGFSFGVLPFSSGYYNIAEIVTKTHPDYDPAVGVYSSSHSGSGGYSEVYAGTGLNIFKNLSAGINMTILFGTINRSNRYDFADFYNVYNTSTTEKLEIHGINFDYGLQYNIPLKKGYYITAGASLTSGKYYNSSYENYAYSFTGYSTRDTISYDVSNAKSTYIPGTLKLGLSYGKKNKFTAGVDYITTKWSESLIPGSTGYAADSWSLNAGAEFIPDKFSNYSYLQRVEYRAGGHFGDNYLIINGEQLKEFGLSCGLGLPMRRSYSKTNLFFDFTRKSGSEANNMHIENFYTVGISLNLYDNWFIKRKYD